MYFLRWTKEDWCTRRTESSYPFWKQEFSYPIYFGPLWVHEKIDWLQFWNYRFWWTQKYELSFLILIFSQPNTICRKIVAADKATPIWKGKPLDISAKEAAASRCCEPVRLPAAAIWHALCSITSDKNKSVSLGPWSSSYQRGCINASALPKIAAASLSHATKNWTIRWNFLTRFA